MKEELIINKEDIKKVDWSSREIQRQTKKMKKGLNLSSL